MFVKTTFSIIKVMIGLREI